MSRPALSFLPAASPPAACAPVLSNLSSELTHPCNINMSTFDHTGCKMLSNSPDPCMPCWSRCFGQPKCQLATRKRGIVKFTKGPAPARTQGRQLELMHPCPVRLTWKRTCLNEAFQLTVRVSPTSGLPPTKQRAPMHLKRKWCVFQATEPCGTIGAAFASRGSYCGCLRNATPPAPESNQ